MLKNNKIKKSEFGSKVTIHRRQKSNGLTILPNTDNQSPKTEIGSGSNPGGAIFNMKEINNYIPLDKSWINRMGVLDLVYGYKDIIDFLDKQENLNDDLLALKRAIKEWGNNQVIDVGESGTLYISLKFAVWTL